MIYFRIISPILFISFQFWEPHWWWNYLCAHLQKAVDRGFEPQSGQTEDYKMGVFCFSPKHAVLRNKSKTGWLRIRMKYLSVATYLSMECCFSELTL